jgi:hypothetical protein
MSFKLSLKRFYLPLAAAAAKLQLPYNGSIMPK